MFTTKIWERKQREENFPHFTTKAARQHPFGLNFGDLLLLLLSHSLFCTWATQITSKMKIRRERGRGESEEGREQRGDSRGGERERGGDAFGLNLLLPSHFLC